jgi:AcrR family transcriptional regulator
MNKSVAPAQLPRGRRRGTPDTRQEILAVARRRFLAEGYAAVSMRSVAAEAGVDPALVSYFFGSKQGLVGAALALTVNPAEALAAALPGPLDLLPERVLTTLLTTWDEPETGGPLRMMLRTSVHDPEIRRLVRGVVESGIVDRLAARLRGPDARQRAAAFTAQLGGVVFTRYLLELAPIATMPRDELVRRLAPALRTTLLARTRRRPT